jgi:hypothetical protein
VTLSQEYLSAVSAMILYGQNQKATLFNYYYYSGSTFSTNPPTGVVAVLKSNGNVVATLPGYQTSLNVNGVQFIFYGVSENSYNFDEVDIYTQRNGTLQYLVSRNTGLNYSKSNTEVVTISFTLTLENTPSIYVNYSFLYLLVPDLILQGVFPFNNYVGITSYSVSGVVGQVTLIGVGITPNALEILIQLTTTGDGIPTITATTTPTITKSPTIAVSNYVFSATLNVKLPPTPNLAVYPIAIGLTYEVES